MNVYKNIPNFNTGEMSALATARIDYEKYHAACETLENFIIYPQGGISRRPGTRFVAEVKTSAKKTRLIKFQFNVTDAYVLEFGENYIRVYKDTARVESGGSPVEIATTYTEAQLFDIQYVQSADVMYLVHPSHAPKKLSRTSDTAWTFSSINFLPPPSYIANTDINVALTLGATSGADVTFTAGSAAFLEADVGRAIVSGSGRGVIAEYTDTTHVQVDIMDAFAGTSISAGQWFLTGSPVASCRPSARAPVRKSIYLALEDPDATEKTITSCSRAADVVTVTCTSHGFSTNDYVSIYATSARKFNIAGKITKIDANSFSYNVKGGSGTPSASTGGKCIKAVVGWRSGDVGKYVKINNGLCKVTQYTSVNDVNTSVDGVMVKAEILSVLDFGSNTPAEAGLWSLEVESFSSAAGYPSSVAIFQQRLWFASTSQQPTVLWGSVTGEYENFAAGTKDDSALDYALTTQNKIRWLAGIKGLVVGTYGEEIVLSTANDAALTPTNVRALTNTTYGSAGVMPVIVGNIILFVQRSGLKLREFVYNFENDVYQAPDLTVLSEHIALAYVDDLPSYQDSGIVDIAYQKEPNSHIWAVRKDGVLLCLVYNKEQNVYGWSRHITGDEAGSAYGFFESVVSVSAVGYDRVWVVIKRIVNGATKRYVEYFEADYWGGSSGFEWRQVNTDSAKVYTNGSPQTVHTGLGHLEGKSVNVIGDGLLQTNKTVSGGQVTIDTAATYVEIGLPYQSFALTVRPELSLPNGSAQGRVKGWSELVARLYRSVGGYINNQPMEYFIENGAKTPFTGDYRIRNFGYDEGGRICIRQPDPLPLTLLSLSGRLSIG